MPYDNWKEVDFFTYCPKCKNAQKDGTEEPCNECLTCGFRLNTRKPINFEEKV